MYTAYLMGGLGNQLFQIAHALCQSWKHDVDCAFLPISNDGYPLDWKPNHFKDNIYRNIKFLETIENIIRVEEKSFDYADLEFDANISLEFYGYFQSSKNFLGYGDTIKNLFSPTKEFIEKANLFYPDINKKTVSLHVRMGDYKQVSKILPVIDKSYIDYCINKFGDYDKLYIFSDEKDWVKQNLNYPNSIVVEGLENYEEMWLMSLCKDNIISNSTFSWWGSFLNMYESKKIYAPSIWFGPEGPSNYASLYEDYWDIVDVEYNNGFLIKK